MTSGISSLPPIVSAPLLLTVFWTVCLALGYRTLRLLRIPLSVFSVWEKGCVCLAIGAGLVQLEPYSLAALGLLNPRNVTAGFLLIAALLVVDIARVLRALLWHARQLASRRPSRTTLIWLALLGSLLAIVLIRAFFVSAFGSDDDGYHLSAPKRWLRDGTLSYLPTYTNTNASLGFEMLYVIGLSATNNGLQLLHASAGVFSLLALGLSARRFGGDFTAMIAVSLMLVATPIYNLPYLMALPYVDFGASWMTMTSVLIWLVRRDLRGKEAGRLLICMALCVGFAASFKSTGLAMAVAWAPILIWEARKQGTGWQMIAVAAIGLGLVALLPVSLWMMRSWSLTGNPVFPMLSSVIPTRDWNAEMARVFAKFLHYYAWANATHLSEGARKAVVAAAAAVVVSSAALLTRYLRDPALRALLIFATLVMLISISVTGMVFRYWLSAVMCFVLVLCAWSTNRWSSWKLRDWLPVVIVALALAVELRKPSNPQRFGTALRMASGITKPEHEYAGDPAWKMWQFINANTPSDARLLVGAFYTSLGASNYGCYWLDRRCFTTDSYIQSYIRLDDWSAFNQSLKKANVEYLIISERQSLPGRIGFSFPAEQNEYPFCRRLADRGAKLAQFGVLQLYRVVADDT